MDKSSKKEYTNGEITVVWQASKCIHSGICVKTLPKVYNPEAKPWIKVDNASSIELMQQIKKCPSGALSYYLNSEGEKQEATQETLIEVLENGPLLVQGKVNIRYHNGRTEQKDELTAFCRCGHSKSKPFCDGSHNEAGFEG